MAACGGVNETAQTLGPGGVFGVMYVQGLSGVSLGRWLIRIAVR